MSSIVKITHASIAEGKNPKEEIYKFLLNYRNTPHSSTGKTPASLMMDRPIKTKLPSIIAPPTSITHLQAQQHDADAKAKQKKYGDKHRRATDRKHKLGDIVLLHQKKTTTKPPFNPDPYTVTQTKGTKITATRRGQEVTRNVDKWKIVKPRPHYLRPTTCGQTQTPEESDSDGRTARTTPAAGQDTHTTQGSHSGRGTLENKEDKSQPQGKEEKIASSQEEGQEAEGHPVLAEEQGVGAHH